MKGIVGRILGVSKIVQENEQLKKDLDCLQDACQRLIDSQRSLIEAAHGLKLQNELLKAQVAQLMKTGLVQ